MKKQPKSEIFSKKSEKNLKLADQRFSHPQEDGRILCDLCPVNCKIPEGKNGKCRVRVNQGGKIYLNNYNMVVQASLDSLRNRPIYLLDNTEVKSLTVGLTGCNNTCPFCQNWLVSQNSKFEDSFNLTPEKLVEHAVNNKVQYISFTYTEPIVWIEYLLETAKFSKEKNIKICLKTAGYISKKYHHILLENVDVMNLDIKPMNSKYMLECGIGNPGVIWDLGRLALSMDIHLEISHIVIPTINDDEKSMKLFSDGIKKMTFMDTLIDGESLGKQIGIHLLRHYPAWKSNYPRTSDETMRKFKDFLESEGHEYVFTEEVG